MDERAKTVEAIQTLVVIAAIPLGLIPLIQVALDRDPNRISTWLFGDPSGSAEWLIPVAVLVVAAVVVLGAERFKTPT